MASRFQVTSRTLDTEHAGREGWLLGTWSMRYQTSPYGSLEAMRCQKHINHPALVGEEILQV